MSFDGWLVGRSICHSLTSESVTCSTKAYSKIVRPSKYTIVDYKHNEYIIVDWRGKVNNNQQHLHSHWDTMLTPIAKKPVTRKKPFPAFLNQYIMVDGQKDDVDTTRRRRGAARNGKSVMHVYSWVTGCVHVYSIFWTYRLSRLYAGTMKVPELEDQEVEISIYHHVALNDAFSL